MIIVIIQHSKNIKITFKINFYYIYYYLHHFKMWLMVAIMDHLSLLLYPYYIKKELNFKVHCIEQPFYI